MFKRNRKSKSRQRNLGSVCVEFALVSPIFFLIIFASIEFARVHMIQSAAENACFEGARRGIVPGATAESCRAQCEEILRIAGVQDFTVQVTPNNIDATTEVINVSADIPITARNSFGISAFFRGRVLRKEITLPRQIR